MHDYADEKKHVSTRETNAEYNTKKCSIRT